MSTGPYIFNQTNTLASRDKTIAWSRLTYLWRSWFSLESLNELTAIITAEKKNLEIQLEAKATFITSSSANQLEKILNVALALADNTISGLTGLLAFPINQGSWEQLEFAEKRLKSEDINLMGEVLLRKLQYLQTIYFSDEMAENLLKQVVDFCRPFLERENKIDFNLQADTFPIVLINEAVNVARYSDKLLDYLYNNLFYLIHPAYIPKSSLIEFIRAARKYADTSVLKFFAISIWIPKQENGVSMKMPEDFFKNIPTDLWLELIQLSREIKDRKTLKEVYEKISTSYLQVAISQERLVLSSQATIELIKFAKDVDDQQMLRNLFELSRNLFLSNLHQLNSKMR